VPDAPERDNGKLRRYFEEEDGAEERHEEHDEDDEQELWLPSGQDRGHEPEAPKRQVEALKEEALMAMRNMTPVRDGGAGSADIAAQVDDLRARLETIQRATADAQMLLAALAPQIEEFASWVTDLENIVGRWHARDARDEEAA
jgi:hypothetical protein